ncbi:hypothetical protein BGZ94_008747 [Podila epigama]|nr:hypothetical protein BGZ94_008747 [Podila epigama]
MANTRSTRSFFSPAPEEGEHNLVDLTQSAEEEGTHTSLPPPPPMTPTVSSSPLVQVLSDWPTVITFSASAPFLLCPPHGSGDFQKTSGKRKLSITEAFQHSYIYTQLVERDHGFADKGLALRYKRGKKKSNRFHNDGRAPDTTATLLRRTGAGRPKGSRNKVPKIGSDVDWSTFGIPWSISNNDFLARNTYPLDTPLMSWYFLHRYSEASLPMEVQQTEAGSVLMSTLVEITSERYDKARWLWCTKVPRLDETRAHDL